MTKIYILHKGNAPPEVLTGPEAGQTILSCNSYAYSVENTGSASSWRLVIVDHLAKTLKDSVINPHMETYANTRQTATTRLLARVASGGLNGWHNVPDDWVLTPVPEYVRRALCDIRSMAVNGLEIGALMILLAEHTRIVEAAIAKYERMI